jgi:hypothetical protein
VSGGARIGYDARGGAVPPRPGSRLDLYLVLRDRSLDAGALGASLDALGLSAGEARSRAVEGGYVGLRLDQPDGLTLYANRQGGFRVACPACAANLVPPFAAALGRWRAGGPFEVACAACGGTAPLDAATFAPPAAFGARALVLLDARSHRLTEWGQATFERLLGRFALVGSRR